MNSRQIILLILVGILTACNQLIQPVISSNKSLGLVEVTFAGNQTRGLNLKASRASRSLSTQVGVLLGALQSRGNFDHNGFRYLWASFSVNNTSTSSLRNVTFMAVATPSTLNGTAVSRLTKFDGNAATGLTHVGLKFIIQPRHARETNHPTQHDYVYSSNSYSSSETTLVSTNSTPTASTHPNSQPHDPSSHDEHPR